MICYVIYSNTEYIDILNISTHYLESYSNKKLIINKSDIDLTHIYSKYNEVIFYDDSLPYASRLLALSKLSEKYILFIHDIDIVIIKNDNIINKLLKTMIDNKLDRIDLQCHNTTKNLDTIEIRCDDNYTFFLNKQVNVNNYIYNVNPSIWKLSTLLEIMNEFRNEGYRTIENHPTQIFCTKYNIYRLHADIYIKSGYFGCLPFFQFLHITSHDRLVPLSFFKFAPDVDKEYQIIYNKYLQNSHRSMIVGRMP